jgi:hypothetical protein
LIWISPGAGRAFRIDYIVGFELDMKELWFIQGFSGGQ